MACSLYAKRPGRVRSRGFSLIELTVVLIIVGILAVVAIPKFIGKQEFATLGFFDATQAAVRYAQKLAIAQRRSVFVASAATSVRLCYDSGCGTLVTDPVRNQGFIVSAPAGVSLAGSSISFDGLGRPSAGATFIVTDSSGSRSFVVEPQTGYVHP